MLKFQNYRHYKLPITMNPLEYGKLIYNNINIFIVQINTTNIALISQYDLFNEIKLFREGDFIFEYKDHKIDDNSFIRSLGNRKFTYKNGQLIEVNKIIVQLILISLILLIILINIDNTSILIASTNIIKLRKVKSEYYNETQIDSFIISYGFKEGIISEKNIIKSDLSFQKYKNNNLVISFNPLDFGKVLTINKLVNETLYILQTKDIILKIINKYYFLKKIILNLLEYYQNLIN